MRLRVGGPLKPSLSVENVGVHYSGGDATVTYTVHNTGNTILTARPAVSVSGPFGRLSVKAGKLADTPPLLPGEEAKASAAVRDVTPALRLTATVTLVPLLTDAAGSTAPLAAVKASGHGWAVPWLPLVAVIALCALVAAGLALRPRRRQRVPARPALGPFVVRRGGLLARADLGLGVLRGRHQDQRADARTSGACATQKLSRRRVDRRVRSPRVGDEDQPLTAPGARNVDHRERHGVEPRRRRELHVRGRVAAQLSCGGDALPAARVEDS